MRRLNLDFWKFWTGQTISNFGSSVSDFALPLLVYKLTGSALNLGIATAAYFLPYLFFGLLIGAWVDRVDRKRLMIATDVIRAVIIASIPAAFLAHELTVWWIYAVTFVQSTLSIFFNSAEFAAIPSLVQGEQDLVTANGRIQASYSAASVAGPFLAGLALFLLPVTTLFTIDALSFLVSAVSLAAIRKSFNATEGEGKPRHLLADVLEGLKYVLGHPVLRLISLMMALVNLVDTTVFAQLVLFAHLRLSASDAQIGWLFSAGSAGVIVLSLLAGPLRKRWTFSQVALGALMASGLLTVLFAFVRSYWVGLVVWAAISGLAILFNINTGSLRQAIVPNHMLGRVISIAGVLAWSAIPVGTLVGGALIQSTQNVVLVYAGIGLITFLIPLAFAFTPLGHADRYIPAPVSATTLE